MIEKVRKSKANRPGVVLVTAVAVLLLVSILLTAVVSYVSVNRTKTNDNYKKEQAYLTASSTVQSFVAQIQQDTAKPLNNSDMTKVAKQKAAIKALQDLAAANGGKGTTVDVTYNGTDGTSDALGKTTVTILQDGSPYNLIVLAKTTYAGKTEQVAAHISTTTEVVDKDLNNCIELLGETNHNYDNLHVIGNMAVLNDSPTNTIQFTNESAVYGKYSMIGTYEPGGDTKSKFILRPSLVDSQKGSSFTVSEGVHNFLLLDSAMPYALGYNYLDTDGIIDIYSTAITTQVGSAGHRVDAFCSALSIAGKGYHQVGNLNVYDAGTSERAGNATISSNDVYIDGDLRVEGNLTITGNVTVTGKVIVGGTLSITSGMLVSGSSEVATPSHPINIDKSGEYAKPSGADTDKYKYYPEDFFIDAYSDTTLIGGAYKSFYDGSNTKTFLDFWEPGFTTEDGCKFNFHVTENCTFSSNFMSYNSGNDFMNGKLKVLVDVTDASGDIVIRLSSDLGSKLGDAKWRPLIVVRNTSSLNDNGEHLKNCYFVSDSGSSIVSDGIDDVAQKSKYHGSAAVSYSAETMRILEYDTYRTMYAGQSILTSDAWNGTEQPNADFVFNPSQEEVEGAYKPVNGNIIVLLGDGCTFAATNNSIFQCAWFGPKATVDIATSGMSGLKVKDKAGEYDANAFSGGTPVNSFQVCNIGAVSAGAFGNKNSCYYVFTKPSSTSIVAMALGKEQEGANGFLLDRYDHY